MAVNRNSPIVPGEGAASIRLGESVTDILSGTTEVFVAEQVAIAGVGDTGSIRYRSATIDLWVKDNRIWQIMVHGAYTGKVLGKIGLGSTLADVEKLLGSVAVMADNWVVKGMPGISFEPQTEGTDSPIIEIYVWQPDWAELQEHQAV